MESTFTCLILPLTHSEFVCKKLSFNCLSTVFQLSFNCLSTVFQLSFNCLSTVFQLSFNCLSTVFQLSFNCLSTVFQLSFNCVSTVFPLCSHCVPTVFLPYSHGTAMLPTDAHSFFKNGASELCSAHPITSIMTMKRITTNQAIFDQSRDSLKTLFITLK